MQTLTLENPEKPSDPSDPNDIVEFEVWKLDLQEYHDKKQSYQDFRSKLYWLVWGQCARPLQGKLESHAEFRNVQACMDGIALLQMIKKLAFGYEQWRHPIDAVVTQKKAFFGFKQTWNMSLQDYYDRCTNHADVLQQIGATIEDECTAEMIRKEKIAADPETTRSKPSSADYEEARERTLAMQFLLGLNDRHNGFLREIRNSYLFGNDRYPKTIREAFHIALHWNDARSP